MNYNTGINWDLFFDQVDLIHDDKPIFIKNFLPKFSKYLSWESVENILNQENYPFSIINSQTQQKQPIPELNNLYNETVQNKEYITYHINHGQTFSASKYSLYNRYVKTLCNEIENLFIVNTDINIFGNKTPSLSFSPHLDDNPLLIFQTYGVINWTIFENNVTNLFTRNHINHNYNPKNLTNPTTYTLSPGDFLYVPERKYHFIEISEPRLTMSVNCFRKNLTNPFDRKYYEIKN